VTHELISVPGGGHGLGNVDKGVVAGIRQRALDFVRRYTQ
jgi:hypothetical protein